ncbi:MAG TPA: PAS domain S-box protein [Dongiaceae bacterium]|nr:PAS domain S-box protein [Dongiaceae bacterium]
MSTPIALAGHTANDAADDVLAFLPEAVVGVLTDQSITFFNASAEQMFGFGAGEVIGRPLDVLLPEAFREHHRALAEGFRRSSTEARLMQSRRQVFGQRRDSSVFPAEVTLVKGRREGRVVMFAIVRDVTEQYQRQAVLAASEQKYRAIIEASPEPILIADAKSARLVEANDAAARLFQCRREDLIGLHQAELHPIEMRERFRRTFREHIDVGRVTVPDGMILTASGEQVPVEISASPVMVDQGLHVVGFFRDMSQRIAHERSLQLALDAANAAVAAKKMFLANMTHELRTPLNGIIGFSELIANEFHGQLGQPRYREYAQLIHSSGQHLLEIVNDLLDLSSLDAGKLGLAEEEVDVAKVVEECRRIVERMMTEHTISFKAAVPAAFRLHADRRAFKQMVLNLLSNAVKYTGAKGSIVVTATDADGEPVISVADTGVGIAAERLARITEPFASADNIYTRRKGGTGIGLSITKALLERHGGRLEIESELGRGTVVRLIFPAAHARPNIELAAAPKPPQDGKVR